MASEPGTSTEHQRRAKAHILSKMTQNQIGVNLGKGMADPYVPVLAVTLGATAPQLGWLQAFINLFPAVMQVPWGKLSDFFGRRIPFLAIGGVMSFSLYFFLIGVVDAWQLIIVVAIQMLIGSMMIPTWSALVGDVTTVKDRGSVMGRFFAISSVASLVGTLFAGAIIPSENATLEDFAIPFFVAGGSGIIGSLVLYEISEEKRRLFASPKTLFTFSIKSLIFFRDLTENKYFRNLVALNSAYNFIMSLIWPLLYLTYMMVLDASALEIGIIVVIERASTLFFQTKVGKLLDVIGPMPQILISRFAFISVPIVYALATEIWHICVLNVALGVASAMANVSFFSYILDVAPEDKKGEYFAVYNTVIGLVTFVGSVIGGYLAYYFLEFYGGDWVLGLGAVYLVSAFGRAAGAIWFLKLKDPVQYPDTLSGVTRKWYRRWRGRITRQA